MDRFDEYIAEIKSSEGSEVHKIIEAADNLLYLMFDNLDFNESLVEQIEEIYEHELEIVRIRVIEVALKLLDYSLKLKKQDMNHNIISFLKRANKTASENIRTSIIIHYSWAHRKYPRSKKLIETYDNLMSEFNKEPEFKKLFEEINYFEGTDPASLIAKK